ncbi:MAG: anhydro-N-acetylmuramic acid kinase [Alteromonadaceae bacterium]|nr:anhydro-N-acetylmuramic acid kinase [Alteromonadaceae bacterium]
MNNYYVGLISGTSMDGVDTVIAEITSEKVKTLAFKTFPYPNDLLAELKSLQKPASNEVYRLGKNDRNVGKHFADCVNALLAETNLKPADITLVGSHGQTVRHHPNGDSGFSVQLGDANTIASMTNIDVVADFRKKDIALGGQGAPMVPAFHKAVFADERESRVVLNIGGIANITYLPANEPNNVMGFDTGPGNGLMDAWCKLHTGKEYDDNGQWAATGQCHYPLLKSLLSLPYFKSQAPKSTGQEQFNLEWLQQLLMVQAEELSPEDVQATLVHLTSTSIADQVKALDKVDAVYVCGGGAHNGQLMQALADALPNVKITNTQEIGISPDAVEAIAFAWLAYAYEHDLPGNVPAVTGASREAVMGGLFKAK